MILAKKKNNAISILEIADDNKYYEPKKNVFSCVSKSRVPFQCGREVVFPCLNSGFYFKSIYSIFDDNISSDAHLQCFARRVLFFCLTHF